MNAYEKIIKTMRSEAGRTKQGFALKIAENGNSHYNAYLTKNK